MGEIGRSLLRGVLCGWFAALAALGLVAVRAAIGPGAPERSAALLFPVPASTHVDLSGGFDEPRGDRVHQAVDIPAPRGADVVAVEGGTVVRAGVLGSAGLSIDQLAASGRRCHLYAHLDSIRPGLSEGSRVSRGETLGSVGTTGNAPDDAPHLHFAVRSLDPGESCWDGEPIDPAPLLGVAVLAPQRGVGSVPAGASSP